MSESPGKASPTVIYDGVCHLCNGSIVFIIRNEREPVLRFTPNQSSFANDCLQSMGIADEAAKSIILIDSGMAYTRSDAAIRIATYLRWPWSMARHLKILPRGLRNWLYDSIAANRYRFFGKSDSCIIPDKSIKHRFTGL